MKTINAKYYLILMIMIFLISISAVNATDITNSTTDITSYDENQLQNDEIPVDSSSKLIKELSDANDNDIT